MGLVYAHDCFDLSSKIEDLSPPDKPGQDQVSGALRLCFTRNLLSSLCDTPLASLVDMHDRPIMNQNFRLTKFRLSENARLCLQCLLHKDLAENRSPSH